VLALAAAVFAVGARAAPSQILYGSDWAGPFKILALDPAGVRDPADVSVLRPRCADPGTPCGFSALTASPDGRRVAFGSQDLEEVWVRTAYGILLPLSHVKSLPTWSRDSRRLAYIASDGLHVASADGLHDRLVDANTGDASPAWGPPKRGLMFVRHDIATGSSLLMRLRNGHVDNVGRLPRICGTLSWSADGRFLACSFDLVFSFSVQLLNSNGRLIGKALSSDAAPAWSPSGARLALGSIPTKTGVRIVDAKTRRTRALRTPDDVVAVAWAPNGRSIAYLSRGRRGDRRLTGDLRELTLSGKLRTLVRADGVAGGTMMGLAWTRSPGATAWPVLPAPDGTLADGAVSALAAAGERVAYVACGLPFVWIPAGSATMLLPAPTTEPSEFDRGCRTRADRQRTYGIALGGRVALYDWCNCPNAYSSVQSVDLTAPLAREAGHGSGAPALSRGFGTLVGDESLLVFSGWEARGVIRQTRSVRQWIHRVESGGCPCPVIAEGPGRLEPLDVDARRIVVQDGESTAILDANGTRLLSLPVFPLAAQLSGNHLLILVPRELRDYDATTGALLRARPFGPIVLGRECQGWFDPGCFVGLGDGRICDITGFFTLDCGVPDWRLEDVARGLVTYVIDGKVHVLRLSDDADTMVGYGTLSRFTSSGLVYADGARLHFVPFDGLRIP
jgi:hypothetical protein